MTPLNVPEKMPPWLLPANSGKHSSTWATTENAEEFQGCQSPPDGYGQAQTDPPGGYASWPAYMQEISERAHAAAAGLPKAPSTPLLVFKSVHHQNTARVAWAMAEVLGAACLAPADCPSERLASCRLLGIGSGVYYGQVHHELWRWVRDLPESFQPKPAVFIFSTSGLPILAPLLAAVGPLPQVTGEVVGDGVNPGGELRRRFIAAAGPIDPHKDLLCEVFGGGVVTCLMQEQGDQPRLPEADQLLKGLGIAITNPQHQFSRWIDRSGHGNDRKANNPSPARAYRTTSFIIPTPCPPTRSAARRLRGGESLVAGARIRPRLFARSPTDSPRQTALEARRRACL
jgi:hypothetical protein